MGTYVCWHNKSRTPPTCEEFSETLQLKIEALVNSTAKTFI